MKYESNRLKRVEKLLFALALAAFGNVTAAANFAQGTGAMNPPGQYPTQADIAPRSTPAPRDWVEWMKQGRFWLGARLRYEGVDQDGFSRRANALTLRTVLGFETARWHCLSGTLEFEDVTALFDENYNSTTNGKTQFPVVVDPEGAEVNQAFLEHSDAKRWNVRIGRQRIAFDNQRFIGNSAWRQNEQTFDAVKLTALDLAGIEASYVYVDNVNRVNGDNSPLGDLPSQTHLVHLSRGVGPIGSLAVYAYLLDSDRTATTSTQTFGARLSGKHAPERKFGFLWTAELATQQDSGSNPDDVDQRYYLGELGASLHGLSLLLGREQLGGSGNPGDAFQTPLATLHSFNGWADKFVTTPDDGLIDTYVSLEAAPAEIRCQAVWHDFRSDRGNSHYGSEIDLVVSYPLRKEFVVGIKFADYDADDFATDTQKFWVWLTLSV